MSSWDCPICTLSNPHEATVCIVCSNERGLVIPPERLNLTRGNSGGAPPGGKPRDYSTFLYCEERSDPPPLADLEAETRTWASIEGGQRPSMAMLRAALTERDALSLYISDWGFNGRPRGWYSAGGRLHYGRFVGSFPTLYWLKSFLKESKSFIGVGGGEVGVVGVGAGGGGGARAGFPRNHPSDEGEDITPTTKALRALYPDGWLRRERSGGGGSGGGGGGGGGGATPFSPATRISEEEEERLSRILLAKLAHEAELEGSSALSSHPSPGATCAVCYTDPATISVCNAPTPHELCLPCTVNLVRTQIEKGNDSIGCAMCPPPPALTHPPNPLGAAKKPGLRSCVVRYEAVVQAQRDSVALVAAAAAAAGGGGGGGGGGGASAPLDLPEDFRALSEMEVQRFSTLCIINAARLEDEAVWVCPNEECRLPVWLEGSGSSSGSSGSGWEATPAHAVACRCSQLLCAQCGGKWDEEHGGKTCEEWHRGKAAAAALDALRNGLKEGQLGKPCPGCGEAVFHARNHGCHHIAPSKGGNHRGGCPNCGVHWCYNCRSLCTQPGHKMACKCRLFCDKDCGCVECPDCLPGRPCPNA